MTNEEKISCTDFEDEVFLFIDNDLSPRRMEKWNNHLENCSVCSSIVKEIYSVENISKEEIGEDILDTKFDKMIEKAVDQNKSRIYNWFFPSENEKGKIAIALKVAVVSGLTVLALVVSLITNRPNPVKTVSQDLLDWEGTKVNVQINEIKTKLDVMDDSDWDKQILLIDQKIKKLEKQSDKFSFN